MTWDNGDRTVLVNPNLRGITLGWNLQSTAQDELFAAIEGTALHTRVIFDRMESKWRASASASSMRAEFRRRMRCLTESTRTCWATGSGAETRALPAWVLRFSRSSQQERSRIEEAQRKVCPPNRVFEPDKSEQKVYEQIYPLYSQLYFTFGDPQKKGWECAAGLDSRRRVRSIRVRPCSGS